MHTFHTDILIIGGGIAGLWLHNRLNRMGYHALLIEQSGLGGGQTFSSQGIIHGGVKYTLSGILSKSATAIASMPDRWRDCLAGTGEIDLSQASVLSPHQLMWSDGQLSSKMTAFFSSKALRGKIAPLPKNEWPTLFQPENFRGTLYRLQEPVLDIPSVVGCLSREWPSRLLQLAPGISLDFESSQQKVSAVLIKKECRIEAQHYVLAAGEGNEALLNRLSLSSPKMQRRALHMVLAKGKDLPPLFAHCIGTSTRPVATITTHPHSDGENIWYIGGNIAEEGVRKNREQQIADTQKMLTKILPQLKLDRLNWTTHHVNRAEPLQRDFMKPDSAFLQSIGNVHVAWPTKLALAPALSDVLIAAFEKQKSKPGSHAGSEAIPQSPFIGPAKLAQPLWEKKFP